MNLARKSLVSCFLLIILTGCSKSLEGEDLKKATVLYDTNVMCSILVKYRVGQVSLLALNGDKHDQLAEKLRSIGADHRNDDFRQRLDEALEDDLERIFAQFEKHEHERIVTGIYEDSQDGYLKKHGYSYPDCDMAIAMSEALIERYSFW